MKLVGVPNDRVGTNNLYVLSVVQLSHLVVSIWYQFGLRPLSAENYVNLRALVLNIRVSICNTLWRHDVEMNSNDIGYGGKW